MCEEERNLERIAKQNKPNERTKHGQGDQKTERWCRKTKLWKQSQLISKSWAGIPFILARFVVVQYTCAYRIDTLVVTLQYFKTVGMFPTPVGSLTQFKAT